MHVQQPKPVIYYVMAYDNATAYPTDSNIIAYNIGATCDALLTEMLSITISGALFNGSCCCLVLPVARILRSMSILLILLFFCSDWLSPLAYSLVHVSYCALYEAVTAKTIRGCFHLLHSIKISELPPCGIDRVTMATLHSRSSHERWHATETGQLFHSQGANASEIVFHRWLFSIRFVFYLNQKNSTTAALKHFICEIKAWWWQYSQTKEEAFND